MTKIFIDGSAGTTGLRIFDRLRTRSELELITLPESLRKDASARRDALNRADVAFLCLPDAAAREAVEMVENPHTVIIDTSTAHRVADGWVYGLAELWGKREAIRQSKRIANPGCHASGFIALIEPLVRLGIVPKDAPLSCFSLTGYSGGGKQMIAAYESENRETAFEAPRTYGLSQQHKHLAEMKAVCGLDSAPIFCPVVAPYYSGMEVNVPLPSVFVNGSVNTVKEVYREYYRTGLIRFSENADENGFLTANAFSGRDDMQITVNGNEDRLLLTARFDNLGKGASGAAIQNMNVLLDLPEETGLNI